MRSITDIRERVNGAIRRAERAGKTDPVSALHEAYIAAFPCAPDVDMSFTSESQALVYGRNPKPTLRGKRIAYAILET